MPKILIVDDEPTTLRLLELAFAEEGRTILTANSYRRAVELAGTEAPFDLAVVDKNLPDGTGLDLVRTLKESSPSGEFIVITGYASVDSAIEAVNLGLFDYVQKPFDDLTHLQLRIRTALQTAQVKRERDALYHELAVSEERYALAAAASNDGLWDWDLQTNTVYLAPRWKALLGYGADELRGSPDTWLDLLHPKDVEKFKTDLNTHLSGARGQFEGEYRMRHKDGTYRWMSARGLAVRDPDGNAMRVVGAHGDITTRKSMEEQLRHRIFADPLTGMANRTLFLDRVARATVMAKEYDKYEFAVLLVDVDDFKKVNDALGHAAGDTLLRHLAQTFDRNVEDQSTLARVGGDEFAVLVEGTDTKRRAEKLAQALTDELRMPFAYDEHQVFFTASIGISHGHGRYEDPQEALRDAEIAMNRAKTSGKNASFVFEMEMHTEAKKRLALDSALRGATQRGEFVAHFQPIVELTSGRIAGFEALTRWQHSEAGLLLPSHFIELAETNGVIREIGDWVLRASCAQLRRWDEELQGRSDVTAPYMSVNVAASQLIESSFPDTVAAALDDTNIAPHRLILELTETSFIQHSTAIEATVQSLKRLGVRLALDDFGTGYSSLSYLFRFPFDVLKIDRAFVQELGHSDRHEALVLAIVRLAEALKLTVVAEGIEKTAQRDAVQRLGCLWGQGWLYSKALPAQELGSTLRTGTLPRAS